MTITLRRVTMDLHYYITTTQMSTIQSTWREIKIEADKLTTLTWCKCGNGEEVCLDCVSDFERDMDEEERTGMSTEDQEAEFDFHNQD